MWNVKTKVVPIIIGSSGAISKSLGNYLSNIPRKHDIKPYWAPGTSFGKC